MPSPSVCSSPVCNLLCLFPFLSGVSVRTQKVPIAIFGLCYCDACRPTFKNIIKKKAVEQYLPIPELTILLKCMLWVLYGLPVVHPNSCLVLTSNAIGLFLQAVYLIIFLIYAAREIRVYL